MKKNSFVKLKYVNDFSILFFRLHSNFHDLMEETKRDRNVKEWGKKMMKLISNVFEMADKLIALFA